MASEEEAPEVAGGVEGYLEMARGVDQVLDMLGEGWRSLPSDKKIGLQEPSEILYAWLRKDSPEE